MINYLFQFAIPFILSALVVILITVIAEKFGTKIGGIIGTIPTTIIIAFIFIGIKNGVNSASNIASIVPGEIGINLVFICIFVIVTYRSVIIAFIISFLIWLLLSSLIFFLKIQNIYLSIIIYVFLFILTIFFLEKKRKTKSIQKRDVNYTKLKIIFRGILTGLIIVISILLSNIDEILSGIFTVFPVIFSSTMIISYKEHGPDFSAGLAKSMIFGSPSVTSYAISIHFLYPISGILYGSIISFIIALSVAIILIKLRFYIS